MTIVEDLLAGPRGRRLCWEVVLGTVGDQPDDDTLFWASYWTSAHRGDGVSLFGPGASEPRPAPSDDDVVTAVEALFDAADPASATLDQVLAALGRAAESAMWWQEPDAEDVLLQTVVPRSLHERIATAVAAAPGVQALFATDQDPALAPAPAPAPAPASASASRQWTVIPDTSGYGGAVRPAAAVLAEWRRELLDERSHGLGDPVTAPISGTWWTTPPSGLLDTTTERDGRGPLGLWAVEDHTGWERAAVAPVAVDPSARIVVVDDAEDWAALCRAAPIDVTATTRRHDWYRATGRDGAWVMPDWAAIAERYDAVHLTLRGWLRASGTAIPVDADSADGTADSADGTADSADGTLDSAEGTLHSADGTPASVIAGWTPDTTVWLRDPRPALGPSTMWRWSGEDRGWLPA
ncbi:hypothetical protein [Curtobacterium sp. MR_MD2014]|uniref:hypothetical protein n=1 Tax=Curtobacterium sp. MR_MD2014 TaxID=1561023 RepID=UPI001185B6E7|nr:hypothetical protein [Curtobacterium sp. MR_MD2014]